MKWRELEAVSQTSGMLTGEIGKCKYQLILYTKLQHHVKIIAPCKQRTESAHVSGTMESGPQNLGQQNSQLLISRSLFQAETFT